jgi:hypothetical protein
MSDAVPRFPESRKLASAPRDGYGNTAVHGQTVSDALISGLHDARGPFNDVHIGRKLPTPSRSDLEEVNRHTIKTRLLKSNSLGSPCRSSDPRFTL